MSAPPELPELRAAVVWSSTMVYPSTFTSRLMAEMMPSVMVPRSSSPSGLPMAATASPTSRRVESPNWAGVRPAQAIFSTARSLCASCPTSRAWNTRSSWSTTSTAPHPSMTWLLVMIYPSSDITTPVPRLMPSPLLPRMLTMEAMFSR